MNASGEVFPLLINKEKEMSKIKGKIQYEKWRKGEPLTRSEAMQAHCYQCNGFEESGSDCQGCKNCPLYAYFAYKGQRPLNNEIC